MRVAPRELPRIVRSGLLLTAALAACARRPGRVEPLDPTVLVTNHSMSPQRIFLLGAGQSRFLGAINPGETMCRRLPAAGAGFQLAARSMERVIVTPTFTPSSAAAWVLELTVLGRYDGLSLQPADAECAANG